MQTLETRAEVQQSLKIQRPHSLFSVRDFGYAPDEQLHYGTAPTHDQHEDLDDRPPWLDDHGHESDSPTDPDDEADVHGRAIALFDFEPENDNEVRLTEGQLIWVSYRHGQGWLVAEDEEGETGLVPEEYVQLFPSEYDDDEMHPDTPPEEPKQVLPEILRMQEDGPAEDNESDWVDEDEYELPAVEKLEIK